MTGPEDWRMRAVQLAARLAEAGALTSPAWRAAVEAVPRHELVPVYFQQDEHGDWHVFDTTTPGSREKWLDLVYSDRPLYTLVGELDGPWGRGDVGLSSSSQPGLMVRMLEVTSNGSWCEIAEAPTNGVRQVWEGGPLDLWGIVEQAHQYWQEQGRPAGIGWESPSHRTRSGSGWMSPAGLQRRTRCVLCGARRSGVPARLLQRRGSSGRSCVSPSRSHRQFLTILAWLPATG